MDQFGKNGEGRAALRVRSDCLDLRYARTGGPPVPTNGKLIHYPDFRGQVVALPGSDGAKLCLFSVSPTPSR
jgi:hypothetical protein